MRRLILTFFLLALFGAGAVYVAYLDRTVQVQFEGKRWALPARVYARPLELYMGLSITPEQFVAELSALKYRPVRDAASPGSYVRNGNELRIVTRPFKFWDGEQPSAQLRVSVEGGTVTVLSDTATGKPLTLARMEPRLIGGIYPAKAEDRVLVQLRDVPKILVDALIAVEDHNFYEHHGIDPVAMTRATLANVRQAEWVQGGSTLTQQLVKNFFLTNERTLGRKMNEAIMALLLEWHYSKDEILETYLNEIYLGQIGKRAIHGVGLAAWFYFDRPVDELRLQDVALLVALIKGPSFYDPRRHPERAMARRNLVLEVLEKQQVITAEQAKTAKAAPLGVTHRPPEGDSPYPAFLDLVKRQLRRDYRDEDLTSEGLRIFTTLDPVLQDTAEAALENRLRRLEKAKRLREGTLEGAVVVTTIEGGEVLALVGGRDARFAGFNRALDALRPIGSLVKPAVYLTALAQPERYTLASLVSDGPLTIKAAGSRAWSPKNYDREYHGNVPLHKALANSYNLATVRLGLSLGAPDVIKTLHRLGVQREIEAYPSVFLGAPQLAPIDIAQMYETLAAGGFRTPLRAIREVLNVNGQPLQRYPLTVEQAFQPEPIFLLNTALQEVTRSGTARSVSHMLPEGLTVAGKTGTTDDMRDSWFAGFSGEQLAVVWLGRDDNEPIGLSGAAGALPLWADIIRRTGSRPLQLVQPADIEFVRIDPESGLRADVGCQGSLELPFITGSAPQQFASCGREWQSTIARRRVEPESFPEDFRDEQPRPPPRTSMAVSPVEHEGGPVRKTIDWLRGMFR